MRKLVTHPHLVLMIFLDKRRNAELNFFEEKQIVGSFCGIFCWQFERKSITWQCSDGSNIAEGLCWSWVHSRKIFVETGKNLVSIVRIPKLLFDKSRSTQRGTPRKMSDILLTIPELFRHAATVREHSAIFAHRDWNYSLKFETYYSRNVSDITLPRSEPPAQQTILFLLLSLLENLRAHLVFAYRAHGYVRPESDASANHVIRDDNLIIHFTQAKVLYCGGCCCCWQTSVVVFFLLLFMLLSHFSKSSSTLEGRLLRLFANVELRKS